MIYAIYALHNSLLFLSKPLISWNLLGRRVLRRVRSRAAVGPAQERTCTSGEASQIQIRLGVEQEGSAGLRGRVSIEIGRVARAAGTATDQWHSSPEAPEGSSRICADGNNPYSCTSERMGWRWAIEGQVEKD